MSNRPKSKDYRHGRVSNDGNGMVGGKWWGVKRLAHKDIKVSDLTESITDTDKAEKALEWLTERIGETFRVEAYFHIGSDESVGMAEICDLYESYVPEEFCKAVDACPFLTQTESDALKAKVQEIAEDEDGYELYEINYPEE